MDTNKYYNSFVSYVKRYIFKFHSSIYYYNKLIIHSKEKNSDIYINKIYTTNNIVESINSKLDYYLPKSSINNLSFINSLSKFLSTEDYKKACNKRNDIIACTFIKILEDNNFCNNLRWLNFQEFIKYDS